MGGGAASAGAGHPARRPGAAAGVACYPGQALTPTDIVLAAQAAFATAREWPQDRIEVATA